KIPPDLIELLPAVADHPACLADVAEIAGKLQQAQLAACYLLVCGHVVLRSRLGGSSQHHPNLARRRHGHAARLAQTLGGPRPERVALLSGDYRLSTR